MRYRSRGPGRRQPGSGFSLVELLVVLMIVGAVSGIALPRYSGALLRYRADLTAKRVAADFELARSYAKTNSTTITISFDAGAHTLRIPALPALNDASGTYEFRIDEAPYHARIVSASFNATPDVSFDMYGKPHSSGTVVIEAGGHVRTINVDADTGVAKVQ